jgi:arsenite methyltransferase
VSIVGSGTRLLGIALVAASLASGCGALKRLAYAPPGRDVVQQPARVVEALAIAPGARVADLGAGGGYFTFRFADAVGAEGRVFAVDVDPEMLDYLRERVRKEGRANIEVIAATPQDSNLPAGGADLIFLCNTYHHISDRVAYFAELRSRLRPGGRVAIVEYVHGDHGTDPEVIRTELAQAGYSFTRAPSFLDDQSFLIFTPIR